MCTSSSVRRIFFFSRSVDGHLRACLPVVRRRSSARGGSGRHRADTACGRSTSARTTPGQFVQAVSRCASASDWPRGFDGALRATTVLFYSGMPKRDSLDETGATAAGGSARLIFQIITNQQSGPALIGGKLTVNAFSRFRCRVLEKARKR